MTLAFLGHLPEATLEPLATIGAAAAAAVPSFALTLANLGFFRDAGIAWAAPAHTPAELAQLAEALRKGLAAASLPVERRAFRPHVTLARHCRAAPAGATMAPIPWPVEAFALMASDTRPEGARYRVVAFWRLSGARPMA